MGDIHNCQYSHVGCGQQLFFTGFDWDGMRQLMGTDMANLLAWKIHRASTVYIGIIPICQETEVQLTALLIISLRRVLVFALLLY